MFVVVFFAYYKPMGKSDAPEVPVNVACPIDRSRFRLVVFGLDFDHCIFSHFGPLARDRALVKLCRVRLYSWLGLEVKNDQYKVRADDSFFLCCFRGVLLSFDEITPSIDKSKAWQRKPASSLQPAGGACRGCLCLTLYLKLLTSDSLFSCAS